MIGREEQLQEVIQHIESVFKSTSQENVLFITGEAGIGKSTFLKAVAGATSPLAAAPIMAMAECSTPLAGQNVGEAESLKPWVDAIDSIVRQSAESFKNQKKSKFDIGKFLLDTAPAWIELIPVLGTTVSAGMEIIGAGFDQLYMNKKLDKSVSAMSQQQIFQQYINLLQKISETTPLVIILDDFHWADDSSCNLLFAASRQLLKKPVVFIIAYRPDDVLTSRDGETHAILHIKNELERYEQSREIVVPRLTANHLDTIMRTRFKNYVNNDEFEEWLAHIAGGNALFITQFLKTLTEDGFLKKDTGEFTGDYTKVKAPKSAYAVINERIRRLNAESRELLQYASVEGETFTAAILSKLTESPQLKTLQNLRFLEEHHHIITLLGKQILYSKETTTYGFSHALMHRAMYETLGEEERELLHEAILGVLKNEWAEALENGANIKSIANRIAIHAGIAKDYLFAAEVLLKAAETAWKEYAEKEALQNINSGIECLKKISNRSDESFCIEGELTGLRAIIDIHTGRFQKAMDDALAASQLFTRGKASARKIDADLSIAYIEANTGHFQESIETIQKIVSENEQLITVSQRTGALSQLGTNLMLLGKPEAGIEKNTEALSLARESGDRAAEANSLDGLGRANCILQNYEPAIQFFKQGLNIAKELENQFMQSILIGNIANVYNYKHEYETALRYYSEALAIFKAIGLNPSEAICHVNMSILFKDLKQYDEALSHLHEAIHICTTSGDNYIAYAYYRMAQTYFEAGDGDNAKQNALKAKALADECGDTRTQPLNETLLEAIALRESEQTKM